MKQVQRPKFIWSWVQPATSITRGHTTYTCDLCEDSPGYFGKFLGNKYKKHLVSPEHVLMELARGFDG